MKNKQVKIIAGPCSIDNQNIEDIEKILNIKINGKRVVAGTRVVGLKSRTAHNPTGEGMGIDYKNYMKNLEMLSNGKGSSDFINLPSIKLAKELQEKYNPIIAMEIMDPAIQMPLLEKHLKNVKLMPWNPSVSQLGWPILSISKYCKRNNWLIGIKNAKNLGASLELGNKENQTTPLEKVWKGLCTYADIATKNKILIHRGVDTPDKGKYRNALVHNVAKRVKLTTGCQLYFDPSHSYGPNLRDKIPQAIIDALHTKIDEDNYLYDGILVETGKSQTDTDQHITVEELKEVLNEVAKYRDLIL